MAKGPSPHLTWAELACKDGTAYPSEWMTTRAVPLAQEFEAIRHAVGGKPVAVLSAYRTPAHNATVGGARHSQHLQGRALDLRPPKGMSVDRFHRVIREVADQSASRIRGIGRYPSGVHIDLRPSDRLVHWTRGTRRRADA